MLSGNSRDNHRGGGGRFLSFPGLGCIEGERSDRCPHLTRRVRQLRRADGPVGRATRIQPTAHCAHSEPAFRLSITPALCLRHIAGPATSGTMAAFPYVPTRAARFQRSRSIANFEAAQFTAGVRRAAVVEKTTVVLPGCYDGGRQATGGAGWITANARSPCHYPPAQTPPPEPARPQCGASPDRVWRA